MKTLVLKAYQKKYQNTILDSKLGKHIGLHIIENRSTHAFKVLHKEVSHNVPEDRNTGLKLFPLAVCNSLSFLHQANIDYFYHAAKWDTF